MSKDIIAFLDEHEIGGFGSLSSLEAPGAGDDTTTIQGILLARDEGRIAIGLGDRILEIPLDGVRHLEKDPSPPSIPPNRGVPVRASIEVSTAVVVQRHCTAGELGDDVGLRPLVLSRPSEAPLYRTRYDAQRDRERHARLGLEWTERPSGPQALESKKMTIGGTLERTVFTTVTEKGDKMDVEQDDITDELGMDPYD